MDVNQLMTGTITGMGYEVVQIERSPKGRTIRIFIDKPDKAGGVDIEDCARVSDQLSRVLTVEDVDYDRLEISSPGLDRPLNKPADFERFAGQRVQIRLRLPDSSGRRNFAGVLLGMDEGKVRIRLTENETTDKATQPVVELEYSHIEKTRLVPVFD